MTDLTTSTTLLDTEALSKRWHITERTLERWRWMGVGPRYLKIGGKVLYRFSDILTHEQTCERNETKKHGGVPLNLEEVAQSLSGDIKF